MFPLKKGATIVKVSTSDGGEFVEESDWRSFQSLDEVNAYLDLWDDISRLLLVCPESGTVQDVTGELAGMLPWYAIEKGMVDRENPDMGWPAWATEHNEFSDAYESMLEELRTPEYWETERLTKFDLL